MRVVMLDPSSFTPPYNEHLCVALGSSGAEVELYTRPLRQHEGYSRTGYTVREHFYRWSERLNNLKLLRPVYRYVKALEHAVDMYALSRELRRNKPDVIHFQWCPLPILDAIFLTSFRRIAPLVLTVHNTKAFHGNPSSWLQGVGWQKIMSLFDVLIVHTEQSRQQLLAAGCQASKITVIPHGTLQARGSQQELQGSSEGKGDDHNQKIILFFGNVKPYKGVDILLKAFSQIPVKSRKDAKVVIAGRSSIPKTEIEGLVEQLGIRDCVELDLRFLSDEELSALLRKAYMYVFPYKDIDASGALMLAIPYGKPIVASRLGIFSELLVDGENALLADVGDHAAFALAIERLLCDGQLARRLGEGARQVVRKYQSWEDIARLTMNTYQALILHRGERDMPIR